MSLRLCSSCRSNNVAEEFKRLESGQLVCGGCFDRLTKVDAPPPVTATENPVVHPPSYNEISTAPDACVILNGKVFDLVERNELCNHSEAKGYEQLIKREYFFCHRCGSRLKKRKKPVKKAEKKIAKKGLTSKQSKVIIPSKDVRK